MRLRGIKLCEVQTGIALRLASLAIIPLSLVLISKWFILDVYIQNGGFYMTFEK